MDVKRDRLALDVWVCVQTCSWATTAKYWDTLTQHRHKNGVGMGGSGCPLPLDHHGVRKCFLWETSETLDVLGYAGG